MEVAVDDGCGEGGDGVCDIGFDGGVSGEMSLLVGTDGEVFSGVKDLCGVVTVQPSHHNDECLVFVGGVSDGYCPWIYAISLYWLC